MKKTILIILSLAVWGIAGQAAEVKSKTDINPQSAEAQTETGKEIEYNLGQAIEYMEQKDFDKALEYLNLHLQNNPASCEGYFLRTMITIYLPVDKNEKVSKDKFKPNVSTYIGINGLLLLNLLLGLFLSPIVKMLSDGIDKFV